MQCPSRVFGPKIIPVIESVYDTFAVFLETLVKIIDPLSHMDVIADSVRLLIPGTVAIVVIWKW